MVLNVVVPEHAFRMAAREGRLEVLGELVTIGFEGTPIVGGMRVEQQSQRRQFSPSHAAMPERDPQHASVDPFHLEMRDIHVGR